jgi:hypothetical protein
VIAAVSFPGGTKPSNIVASRSRPKERRERESHARIAELYVEMAEELAPGLLV